MTFGSNEAKVSGSLLDEHSTYNVVQMSSHCILGNASNHTDPRGD